MGSKAQFQSNAAPPPPDQIDTLLNEDVSPATSLRDPHRLSAGNFSRTKHYKQPTKPAKNTTPMGLALGHVPPPKRSMTYPVLVAASPTAKPQVRSCDSPDSPLSTIGSPK